LFNFQLVADDPDLIMGAECNCGGGGNQYWIVPANTILAQLLGLVLGFLIPVAFPTSVAQATEVQFSFLVSYPIPFSSKSDDPAPTGCVRYECLFKIFLRNVSILM
jgi:hypothetical protein